MRTNGKLMFIGCLAVLMIVLASGTSFSAVVFRPLAQISAGPRMPEDVAISPVDGKLYVVDGSRGKVLIYDKKNHPAGSISIPKPTSVAVDNSGKIYIGTNSDLSVKIFDTSLQSAGSLGAGAGEFRLPRNITIDSSTGNIYVVDQLDNSIKAYTSGGVFIRKINDYPNLPQDVTIVNNEIYVIDSPLIVDQWGGTIRGAEVQVFDTNGAATRHFGSFGTQEGQLIRPVGITSDTGILYITDSFHGVVLCFNTGGTYLGAIQNPPKPMVTPMGLALGEDRRLFVASLNTSSVHTFGLDGYVGSVDVSPLELSFTAEEGQTSPPDQTLTINNPGTESLTYTAARDQSWIVLNVPSLAIGPSGTGTMLAGVNVEGLAPATYAGQITITDSSGANEVVAVKLVITPRPVPPVLSITPLKMDYTYKIGEPAHPSQILTVELSQDTIIWAGSADPSWISVTPTSGGLYTQATVDVDPTNLDAGTYKGSITIEAPGAMGSPATVEVNLTVQYGGTINVACNITGASFTITGPKNYDGSGQTWTAAEVPDGKYTITYGHVTGYKAPQTETKELSGSSAINFEGNYVSLGMTAEIVVSRAADIKNPPSVGIFDAGGKMLTSFVPFSLGKYSSRVTDRDLYGKSGVNTAVGDINGDGKVDVVVGLAAGSGNPARVAAYGADGTLIPGSDFIAMSTMYGANVAVADFDGDGKAEIVVGAGLSPNTPSRIRIFKYESGTIIDTGIKFNAFGVKGGVNIATGDVDGDGVPELVTAAGSNRKAMPEVRVWKINTTGIPWSVTDTGIDFVAFTGRYGAGVVTGDINGDGISEIVVGSGPDPLGGPNKIVVFKGDGTAFGLTITDSSTGYGLNVASADLNDDGVAEIVAGLGPLLQNPATVKVYKADGTLLTSFNAFDGTHFGAVVSAGDLGY